MRGSIEVSADDMTKLATLLDGCAELFGTIARALTFIKSGGLLISENKKLADSCLAILDQSIASSMSAKESIDMIVSYVTAAYILPISGTAS